MKYYAKKISTQNEFMKSSFLQKYERKIVTISKIYRPVMGENEKKQKMFRFKPGLSEVFVRCHIF